MRSPNPAETAAIPLPRRRTPAVVMDNGRGCTKAGFVGEESPRALVDAPLGPGAADWSALEKLWHHVLRHALRLDPRQHGVLLAEPPLTPKVHRERWAEILFEGFGVPAFYTARQPLLSLYSVGRTTGLVVEAGSAASSVSLVHEGFVLPNATYCLNLAGHLLTMYLRRLLRDAGYYFGWKDTHLVKHIKEHCCYLAQDYQEEILWDERDYTAQYRLPDGFTITLKSQRFRCPEALFRPPLVGLQDPGLHILAFKSLQACCEEYRGRFLENVVVCGGTSLLPGFGQRLGAELRKLSSRGARVEVTAAPYRGISAWVGGSILASLSSFQSLWIPRQQYDEMGPYIIHRKCF
ncbi:actin-like [Heterodontus francisci]|uniref:actin-like n=1 Tax=Heterodontus francisci TaxID=7792 RepID=UPI00355C71D6